MLDMENSRIGGKMNWHKFREEYGEGIEEHMSPEEYIERLYQSGHRSLARDLERKRKKETQNDQE